MSTAAASTLSRELVVLNLPHVFAKHQSDLALDEGASKFASQLHAEHGSVCIAPQRCMRSGSFGRNVSLPAFLFAPFTIDQHQLLHETSAILDLCHDSFLFHAQRTADLLNTEIASRK